MDSIGQAIKRKEDPFSKLRTLLTSPGAESWDALLTLFADWEEQDTYSSALEYAEEHLEDWPGELCIYPQMPLSTLLEQPASWPPFRLARSLFVESEKRLPRAIKALTRSPKLGHLERLSLRGAMLQKSSITQLSRWSPPPKLRVLDLSYCGLGPKGCRPLANATWLESLRTLVLRENALSGESIHALMDSERLTQLTALDIATNPLTKLRLAQFAQSFPMLQTLHLAGIGLDDAGLAALTSDTQHNLHTLDLCGNSLTYRGAQVLAATTHLPALQVLYLNGNRLGNRGVITLANAPLLRKVHTLSLAHVGVIETGVEALLSSSTLTRLRNLDLSFNIIGRKGIETIADAPNLQGLESLDLTGCMMEDATLALLAQSNALPSLRLLKLGYDGAFTTLTREGILHLARSPNLPNLTHIALSEDSFTDDDRQAVAACLAQKT